MSVKEELSYWNKAAADAKVDIKYIADVSTEKCLSALGLAALPTGLFTNSTATILDLGCGVGRLAIPIANNFANLKIVGVDISPKMLATANKRFKNSPSKLNSKVIKNFTTKLGDGRSIPLASNKFSSAYSMLLFQHLDPETIQGYLSEVYRVLRHGTFRFQFVEGNYHGHLDHNYTESEMTQYVKDAGFTVSAVDKGLVHPQWTWITGVKK